MTDEKKPGGGTGPDPVRSADYSTLVDQACKLADEGMYVFPIVIRWDEASRKHIKKPVQTGWQQVASCELENVERMPWGYTSRPDEVPGIGISCGPSNICVLDVDGDEALAKSRPPPTRMQETLREGGRHFIYRAPPFRQGNTTAAPYPGVDIRGEGGFIAWYGKGEMIDDEIQPWPYEKPIGSSGSDKPGNEPMRVYGEGERNDALSRHLYGAFKRLPGAEYADMLAIAKAFNADWCSPPLSLEEVQQVVGGKWGLPEFAQARQETAGSILAELDMSGPLEGMSWAIKGVLQQGGIGLLYGRSQTMKSFIALGMLLSIATGKDWMGRKSIQGVCWYMANEGGGGLKNRARAWCKHAGVTPATGSFYTSTQPLILSNKNDRTEIPAAIVAIMKMMDELGPPDYMGIDTVAKSMGGEENSNTEMGAYLHWIEYLRSYALRVHGKVVGVLLVHHTGKNSDDSRGAYALPAGVDFVYKVSRDETGICTLANEKIKDGRIPADLYLMPQEVELGLVMDNFRDVEPVGSLVMVPADPASLAAGRADGRRRPALADRIMTLWPTGDMPAMTANELVKVVAGNRQKMLEQIREGLADGWLLGGLDNRLRVNLMALQGGSEVPTP